ncbi:MAG: hypothetical protein HOP16_08350 [Acidobacteria bacterium]|nr:hypothetical protein [Acidobacteriota bacterium]
MIFEAAPGLADGAKAVLRSPLLPYEIHLWKRHSRESRIFAARYIDSSDSKQERTERIRTALTRKIPKLVATAAARINCKSVLILESDDIALSNVFAIAEAFRSALASFEQLPDYVFLVETDGGVPVVSILKDGARLLPHEPFYEDFATDDE